MPTLIDSQIALRSNLMRKGIAFGLQAPRALKRWGATEEDYRRYPPIVVDSIPKSGTHLLMQVARSLPDTHYFGSFVAWSSSLTLKKRSDQAMLRRLSRIAPGEVVGAHLHYSPAVKEQLHRLNAVHWLIIRDPVDVLLSEAHYLRSMNRFHRMAREFRSLSQQESIERALLGSRVHHPLYPSFEDRMRPYLDWLQDEDCLIVRYEHLREADPCEIEVRRLVRGWLHAADRDESILDQLTHSAMTALDPKKSHTFSRRLRNSEAEQREQLLRNSPIRQLRTALGYDQDAVRDRAKKETADT
ncbi:sulfotransferase domain-containing protein [Thiorhodovibrio litoralis]|uniref:sulfotransferase domain-containing protein n=1 Tax=Thiorhodovibrio litoralis TaxID=2952932 RepID=UPI002B25F671|nr:sulfotransferase domain-containing protein [Thiorhodovibrio litoralis]WPL11558.1 Sulfotransferase domain protein [Thiorhodovibrio litoralis]